MSEGARYFRSMASYLLNIVEFHRVFPGEPPEYWDYLHGEWVQSGLFECEGDLASRADEEITISELPEEARA